LHTTVEFRRHSVMFGVCMLLPCLVAAAFNILPFFLPSLNYSVYTLLSNVIIQATFLQEIVNGMPLSASQVPKSVLFYSVAMVCNMLTLVLHILLVINEQQAAPFLLRPVLNGLGSVIAARMPFSLKSPIVALRAALGIATSLLYIVSAYMKLIILCFACICSVFMYVKAEEEPEGIDDQGGNPEEVYNKTYREYHTYLEIALFTEYKKSRRPVRTSSTSTNVTVHFDIHHVSINQNEQTMTVHGTVLMKWLDEFLGWDPQDFKGIEFISCPEWRVWRPKIRVANSASGVFSNYEVASYAHVLVKTLGKEQAMLSMYPLFSAKVGCNLDFSTFPEDAHSCTVSFFTKQSMNEVRLAVLNDMAPTVNLGWDAQSNKRIISDFEILNVSSELFYYRNGDITALEPSKNELSSACDGKDEYGEAAKISGPNKAAQTEKDKDDDLYLQHPHARIGSIR
uniref:Neur_chan_LBD domain-containing protein n=1 Tax=Heligmosomoides polygyrus TaxID=6339 RepID=A0A183F3R5_HELPZ